MTDKKFILVPAWVSMLSPLRIGVLMAVTAALTLRFVGSDDIVVRHMAYALGLYSIVATLINALDVYRLWRGQKDREVGQCTAV